MPSPLVIRYAFTDIPDLPDRHPSGYIRPADGRGKLVVPIGPQNPEFRLLEWLRKDFILEHDPVNPSHLFFSTFGYDFLQFPEAIRIFLTSENIHPDFNICDYAFGFDRIEFGDRYARMPNFLLYEHFEELVQRKQTSWQAEFSQRNFCNFIYTNRAGHPLRDELFHTLQTYRRVDSAGGHLNNMGKPLGRAYCGDWSGEKVSFQRGYKFSFAFENSSSPGYCTEKIVHALAADSIPIYWGDPTVGRQFNSRRFINCHDFDSVDSMAEHIRRVDQDDALYRSMLNEPYFPSGNPAPELSSDYIRQRFGAILSRPPSDAIRRNRHFWGRRYDERLTEMWRSQRFLHGKGGLAKFVRGLAKLTLRD